MNIYNKIKLAAQGNDDAVTELLSKGTVESFTENDRGMVTECFIFTDSEGNSFTYSKYNIDRSRFKQPVPVEYDKVEKKVNKDLGKITLKNGAEFYAVNYKEAVLALSVIKNHYEGLIDGLVDAEDYSKLEKVRKGIEEIEEKIDYYTRKQGENPGGSSIKMGNI